jgi:hypothetical protein
VNRALLDELLNGTRRKELVDLVGSSLANASKFGLAFPKAFGIVFSYSIIKAGYGSNCLLVL